MDIRHDVVKKGVRFAGVEQRYDVRVLKPGSQTDLGQEPFGAE